MLTTKITESEIQPISIASLPTRPTAPTAFGGKGYSSVQMKECFDKLPRLIIERLNLLIGELQSGLIQNAALALETGIAEGFTLADFLREFSSGELAMRFPIDEGGKRLGEILPELIEKVNSFYYMDEDFVLDGGVPAQRGGEL